MGGIVPLELITRAEAIQILTTSHIKSEHPWIPDEDDRWWDLAGQILDDLAANSAESTAS
jgi:hypothetical protein